MPGENAARVQHASGDFNLLDLLPRIVAPTLVLHSRDDTAIPFEQSRLIAGRIPGARFVTLEGRKPHPAAARSGLGDFRRRGAPVSARGRGHDRARLASATRHDHRGSGRN